MGLSKKAFIKLINNSKEISNLELSDALMGGIQFMGYTFVNCNFTKVVGGFFGRCVFSNCRFTEIDNPKFETSVFFNCALEMCTFDAPVQFHGNYLINCTCNGLMSHVDNNPNMNSFIGCDIEDHISDYPAYGLLGCGLQKEGRVIL